LSAQQQPAQADDSATVGEVATTAVNEAPTRASDPVDAASEPSQPRPAAPNQVAQDADLGREYRTAFYRADANQPPSIPQVVLSSGHEALCRVKVGDTMPEIELEQLGGRPRRLADLAGKTATVVVFWKSGSRMTDQQLVDIGPDVIEPFGAAGVAVVGIAVDQSPANVQAALERAGANFPTLVDSDGKAFALVGSEKMPRTYLLDPQGKILWFDIEYSLSTRRELHQALRAITAEQSE
jgi:peroxiredoxin